MADVKVRIIAVDEASEPMKKAGQEVENVGKKAKEAGGAFEGMGKTMSAIAGGLGLQMGLSAIVGALKNAIVGSFELADALEQSKIAFTTMLGSGEAAGQMLNDLKSFADKTPFEFQDIQAAAKRLMAMGTAAEDVIPTLTAVGDAAAGLGGGKATIDSITLALGQMGAKGKISTQELNQLTERGIPALRYLAEAAGVTTGEMAKLVEKGLVPADQGVQVLLASMKQDFGGMMALQAETASGKLSTMKDAMAGLATETGKTFVPAVKAGADVITEMANAAEEYIARVNRQADAQHDLVDAFKNGYVDVVQFGQAVETTVNKTTSGYEETTYRVIDFAKAYDLLKVAGVNQAYAMEQSETRFTALYEATHKSTIELKLNTDAVDGNKEALRLQADSFSTLSGASKEYDTDTDKLAKTHQQHLDDIAKLTKGYQGNHAALLAGKGTVVDNTREIEAASIAAARSEISFGKLNERFSNQDNINKYNDGVSDLNTQQDKLNKSFADGKIDGDKLAEGLAKISDKNNDLKNRLHDSQMSTDDFNLSVRQHAVDVANGKDRMGELVSKHGEGKTAAELAAGATAAYNIKLAEMKLLLEQDALADAALQAQTALRIKEGLVLDEIKLASEGGLTEAELANIQVIQTAMGLQDDAAINGMLSVQRGATLLAGFRKQYAADFDKGNTDSASVYATQADLIGRTTNDKVIPTLAAFEQSAKDARKELREISTEYNGLQSKEVTLKILTIKQEINLGVSRSDAQYVDPGKGAGAGTSTQSTLGQSSAAPKATGNKGNAMGGSVQGGRGSYLVGELGPELFNPAGTGGTIVPNNRLTGGGGLAIGTLNIYGVQSTSELFNQLSKEARARGMQFAVA